LHAMHAGNDYKIRLPLVGDFQIENALVAAGLVVATGGEPAAVFAALENLKGAKGRLERVGAHNGAPIFVDYAHKPDALAKALEALRPYVSGRLSVVFGAGGDRDPGKRPMMGRIAAEKADRVIVTDDNPRSEEAASIRAAILAAAPGAREIGDRGEAIRAAIAELAEGDVLLIAGKGHETGQIVGKQVLPFSDHEAVAAALAGRGVA
jgi:UDP-N-acetylmuramoyl-L-alanyl-D-glutamate--2,6-diaminopimelate ligase